MKTNHYKYHTVSIPLYMGSLHVIVAHDLAAAWQMMGYELKENPNDFGAWAWDDTCHGEWGVYCLLRPNTKPRTVAHEALHLLTYIMKRKGIGYDPDNDEPLAYLIGWLVDQINHALTGKEVKATKKFRIR